MRDDPVSGKISIKTSNPQKTHPGWITEQRHRAFGKCYSIQIDEMIRNE